MSLSLFINDSSTNKKILYFNILYFIKSRRKTLLYVNG